MLERIEEREKRGELVQIYIEKSVRELFDTEGRNKFEKGDQ